jgi:hypothetical protein
VQVGLLDMRQQTLLQPKERFNVHLFQDSMAIVALREVKQWKHEIMEDYYDRFLQLCVVIPQQPNDVYLQETFKEGLRKKLK